MMILFRAPIQPVAPLGDYLDHCEGILIGEILNRANSHPPQSFDPTTSREGSSRF